MKTKMSWFHSDELKQLIVKMEKMDLSPDDLARLKTLLNEENNINIKDIKPKTMEEQYVAALWFAAWGYNDIANLYFEKLADMGSLGATKILRGKTKPDYKKSLYHNIIEYQTIKKTHIMIEALTGINDIAILDWLACANVHNSKVLYPILYKLSKLGHADSKLRLFSFINEHQWAKDNMPKDELKSLYYWVILHGSRDKAVIASQRLANIHWNDGAYSIAAKYYKVAIQNGRMECINDLVDVVLKPIDNKLEYLDFIALIVKPEDISKYLKLDTYKSALWVLAKREGSKLVQLLEPTDNDDLTCKEYRTKFNRDFEAYNENSLKVAHLCKFDPKKVCADCINDFQLRVIKELVSCIQDARKLEKRHNWQRGFPIYQAIYNTTGDWIQPVRMSILNDLAWCYREGLGVGADIPTAIKIYRQSYTYNGNPVAIRHLKNLNAF